MSSLNKKTSKKRYAEDRRQFQRKELEQNLRADAENELQQYLDEQKFSNDELIQAYPAIYEFIKRKAPNLAWKKYAHEFFRTYIKALNQNNNQDLPLPHLTFEMKRDEPIFTLDWIQAGHEIDIIIEKLWDYWILAQDSSTFSDDEIIANILLCSMLYGGLSQTATLNALLEHLKNPGKIQKICDFNIIFLEPLSPSYGDLFVDEKTIRKSRNFVPDELTRLWLIHFNTRQIRDISLDVNAYLHLIFQKIKHPYTNKTFKFLRDYANFNWLQLPNADVDPALSQCLLENTLTCGLSEHEFENFALPKFKTQLSDEIERNVSSTAKALPDLNTSEALENIIFIHKNLLKMIRTSSTEQPIAELIIDFCLRHQEQFNEFSKRIILWLISLYRPSSEQIKKLSATFDFDTTQYTKAFQDNQKLVDSSIYTYYTRIAEPFLTHALQYFDADDDINDLLNKIYQQIISNTRLADEANQPEFKRSKDQTIRMLKRFHTFQQIVFQAEDFEIEFIASQSRPRARIIGHTAFQVILKKLNQLLHDQSISDHHYKLLKIIYILAYRTGMRINEILGLRVKDIEGLNQFSIWVQPYGSKKQGNQHLLKTDSAERIVPAYALLKDDEYQFFSDFVVEKRLEDKKSLYLFSNLNENKKLNKHTVTVPLKLILNQVFKGHHYSFHSFRHTAANHLSLLLNCEYAPLVQKLTDYSENEYQKIRAELLQNQHGQNHWFVIAHLLGHIEPVETFKSYIHLSYLIAGQKLLKHHPDMPNELAKKIMGHNATFKNLKITNDEKDFNFEKNQSALATILLNDQTKWLQSNATDILDELSLQIDQSHDFFAFFVGTEDSKISLQRFYETLNILETTKDPKSTAQRMCLPEELVNYWYENALNLANIKSKKGNPRLFSIDSSTHLKPAMLDSAEELHAVTYFFEHLQKIARKNPIQIACVLNIFLNRVTASHTGIHYRWKDIDQLEHFYSQVKALFPAKFWHLLGQDLQTKLDAKQQPQLFKLAKASTDKHPSTQEEFPRLQLYSVKDGHALAAFKFCLHLACIGRPRSVQLNELDDIAPVTLHRPIAELHQEELFKTD
ncbi:MULTISPECIES: site-specific integrase [unclassified Acinetobacter]|uniref:site-specific integrase n=1 Tax=unclassified Acinetobacter TaxID=196816 RepID=UPI002577DE75|nr:MULTISPECIES: site-specific integrase [unclassified Acinetobacter]MDM1764323.1 site-specific integrase [Acinetobacter sp. 226-1]MDM1767780.1 site-specific integrase [Acinetobacter sp. 226-4]